MGGLPTAATPGYGYLYTLGDTPNVACNCLREWIPWLRKVCIKRGLGDFDVWQCTGGLSASGGTHSAGGAFDLGGISSARVAIAREMGAPATWARNWTGNRHTHGVLTGCVHNSPAHYQITAQLLGRDGLGYKGLAGPDPHPRPKVYRDWRQGIEWAKAQLGLTTTPTPTTSEEFDMATSEQLSAQIKAVAEMVAYVQKQVKAVAAQNSALDVEDDAQFAQLLAAIQNVDEATMFGQTVARGTKDIPVIQEIADIKTAVQRIEAALKAQP